MNMQTHKYPQTAPVAANPQEKDLKAKFPALTIADYGLTFKGVYALNDMGFAELLEDRRGLPNNLLCNAETGDPIYLVDDKYRPVPNGELYGIITDALEKLLPPKFLQNVTLDEIVENGYAYNELRLKLKDFRFKLKTANGWETHCSPVIMVKNAAQNAVITIMGAECETTGNILSFGNKAAKSQRHVGNFGPEPIEAHLRYTLMEFPKAVQALQELADHKVNLEQCRNALEMYTKMTDTVIADILDQYIQVTVPEMGTNKFAFMMAVADYACDAEAFPVKNAAKADNVGETLALRKKWMAGLVSSPFFFGRGGFYA